ncbi:MAG: FAD:protein FMN transferase [Bacteroidetes bacterium]|nr:MAG: FAD:protein FMN transferase [Bacteroidota bacterium]
MKYFVFVAFALPFLIACNAEKTDQRPELQRFSGETMGTYYQVTYVGEAVASLPEQVEDFLRAFNEEVSTYIPSSTISRFNQGVPWDSLRQADHFPAYFVETIRLSQQIYLQTQGCFDPTVMPLVNYWGFGYTPKRAVNQVDSTVIDSLMQFVGFDKLELSGQGRALMLRRKHPQVQLDFSAIAKGFAIDLIAKKLEEVGIQNYLIDIGGEALARGDKGSLGPWRLGISIPLKDAALTAIQTTIPLRDQAIATSGNYRIFHEVEGQIYGHTINPFTGYPELSHLLSASILAPDCATADAFATAAMVAGLEKAYALVDSLPQLEGYFIYADEKGELRTKATPGFAEILSATN